MTLVKFNTRPVHKTFNNLFDELLNDYPSVLKKDWNNNLPPVNIFETAEAYQLELNVPGRNKEDFQVSIENGLLTISFEKKDEAKNNEVKTVLREFGYNNFKRSFSLETKIDVENIQAKYENGLLKFYLPKKEQAKDVKKQISVQ